MVKKKSSKTSDDLALERPHESEEEEEYEVADLSAVPTPKIEFVMPNLTPLENTPKKSIKKLEKRNSPSTSTQTLTAEQLNMEIVQLRSVVQKARRFLVHRLVRKMKRMELILAKKESDAVRRKVQRYEEEVRFLKRIRKDDVSKFALMNKKSLDELRITDKTPVKERCMYKLACEASLVKAVQQYRSRYPSWEVTTAFLLQRLGIQYASAKEKTSNIVLSNEEDGSEEDNLRNSEKRLKPRVDQSSKEPRKKPGPNELHRVHQQQESAEDHDYDNKSSESENEDDTASSGDDHSVSVHMEEQDNDDKQTAENRGNLLLGSVSNVRKVKKKKMPKRKDSLVAAPKTRKEMATTTAVIKKVKLNKMSTIKLSKSSAPTVDLHPQHDPPNNSTFETDHFFIPASSAADIQKNDDASNRSSATASKDEDSLSTKRIKLTKQDNSVTGKGRIDQKKKGKPERKSTHLKATKLHDSSEKLHPSWAARRQAKELQLSAPQSKRIVFDED